MVDANISAHEIITVWKDTVRKLIGNEYACDIGVSILSPFDYERGICKIAGVQKYNVLFDINIKFR